MPIETTSSMLRKPLTPLRCSNRRGRQEHQRARSSDMKCSIPGLFLLFAACAEREVVTAAKYQTTQAPIPAPLPKVIGEVVAHGPRSQASVALTFDACSTRDVS